MKPWSPAPWVVGGNRTTTPRTPLAVSTIFADGTRGASGLAAVSFSVAGLAFWTIMVPELLTNGLPVPSIAAIIAATAERSFSTLPMKSDQSWTKAVWMTPSVALAPATRLAWSVMSPRWTSTPRAVSLAALSSLRASPSTVCPRFSNSGRMAEPIQPVAPVKKTRMSIS